MITRPKQIYVVDDNAELQTGCTKDYIKKEKNTHSYISNTHQINTDESNKRFVIDASDNKLEFYSPDIDSFKQIQDKCFHIFMERRLKYGNHIDNHKRFPSEHICGLYLKCVRIIRMIENDKKLDADTLIDTGIYANILLSTQQSEDE